MGAGQHAYLVDGTGGIGNDQQARWLLTAQIAGPMPFCC